MFVSPIWLIEELLVQRRRRRSEPVNIIPLRQQIKTIAASGEGDVGLCTDVAKEYLGMVPIPQTSFSLK